MTFSVISSGVRCRAFTPRTTLAAAAAVFSLAACGGGGESTASSPLAGSSGFNAPALALAADTPALVDSTGPLALADSGVAVQKSAPGSPALNAARATGRTACDSASGTVREVGPGKTYAVPSAAAAIAKAGDVVRIAAGEYRGDVAFWSAPNLTICGVGGRARLYADGRSAGGKAIWVISGSDITIDSVEFHDTAVRDLNGAGIRMEHKSGNLRIVNSGFYDNQNGILTAGGPVTLTIEGSEFARNSNGRTDGQTHNLYVGDIEKLTVSNSYFHEARYGSNLKSRAKVSIVENSYLMDGASGPGSYLTDFSNGGKVVLRGNLFHKGPLAPNRVALQFGAEGKRWSENTLEMSHNTVVMTRANSIFLRVAPWAQSVNLTANVFASTDGGNALISNSEFPLASIKQRFNAVMPSSLIPGASSIAAPNFWPNAEGLRKTAILVRTDKAYTSDAPAPFVLRPLQPATPARIGALQTAP